MTESTLREEISKALKETLPLICPHCQGGGSNAVEGNGDENCPECGGSGLKGFTNDYAEGLVLNIAHSFAISELERLYDDTDKIGKKPLPPRAVYIDQSLMEGYQSWENGWEAGCLTVSTDMEDVIEQAVSRLREGGNDGE